MFVQNQDVELERLSKSELGFLETYAEQKVEVTPALSSRTKPARRGYKEIGHDIIKAAGAGTRKTAIMYGSRLNPGQLNSHLKRLIEEGFVERDAEKSLYRATQKGKRYMKAFERYTEGKLLLSEQERVLEDFWEKGDDIGVREVVGEAHGRRKDDLR